MTASTEIAKPQTASITSFSEALAAMTPRAGGGFEVSLPSDWLQGRTAYGGLSAALCVEAVTRAFGPLPPLRSAQFAFAGPASGRLDLQPVVLRQSKNSLFAGVDLKGDEAFAVRAALCLANPRPSALDHMDALAPPVLRLSDSPAFFDSPRRPTFSQHFESRLAAGSRVRTPDASPSMVVWLRHRDPSANSSLPGLIALADAIPAAAMVLFKEPAPISTMTWSIELLTDHFVSPDGWWLVRCRAESVQNGYSAQDMAVWDSEGRPILVGRQTVAVFT